MTIYDTAWAAEYERRAVTAMPGREGLYRICRAALADLPSDARVLVVGCGTGEELVALGRQLPAAAFVGVDPSAAMLEHCVQRVAEAGIADRVRLHGVALDEFAGDGPFDAVTSILVSQHLPTELAQEFFSTVAACLKPGGILYSADLHIPAGQDREAMLALWRRQSLMSGADPALVQGQMAMLRTDIRPRDEAEILGFLGAAGFVDVLKPFASLVYGAWTARRGA